VERKIVDIYEEDSEDFFIGNKNKAKVIRTILKNILAWKESLWRLKSGAIGLTKGNENTKLLSKFRKS
jgi:hypothetical protein